MEQLIQQAVALVKAFSRISVVHVDFRMKRDMAPSLARTYYG